MARWGHCPCAMRSGGERNRSAASHQRCRTGWALRGAERRRSSPRLRPGTGGTAMTGEAGTRDLVRSVWEDQSVWSQTANLLKARLDHHRSTMLALTVASAVLTTLAAQILSWSPSGSKVLALSAGV